MQIVAYYLSKIIKKLRLTSIKQSSIHRTSKIESGSLVVNSIFGRHSFCGYDCEIINCEVGSFCSIANNVIVGGGMHPINWLGMSPVFYEGKDSVKTKISEHKRPTPKTTRIGHDVWIGHSALIKQGVCIGTGAVVGMGSVVTKDVPPYAIVAGNPARLVRYRFDEKLIENLLKCEWWNFSDEKLKGLSEHITDPREFILRIDLLRNKNDI